MNKELNEILLNNYEKALKQKYNAVCFDIDGTLTSKGSTQIDTTIIPSLADLIFRRVPIVFITGRGETGIRKFIDDFSSILINEYKITNEQLSKIYALTNDGARLFSSSNNGGTLFDQSIMLSEVEELAKLNDVKKQIEEKYLHLLGKYFDISYSYVSDTQQLMNIRLVLKTKDKQIIDILRTTIDKIIDDQHSEHLNVTKGHWNGYTDFQIGVANKKEAIEETERIIGVPENSMLRIGDCGGIDGNDYAMLNCPQGFSVKETSNSLTSCFPIVNNEGIVLNGVEATKHLLSVAKILPTICLEKAIENRYRKEYSQMEMMINKGRIEHLQRYNEIIDKNFAQFNGVDGIFKPQIGGLYLPMYEWELIDDSNSLKKLWEYKQDGNRGFSLYTNNSILLRGSKTYYNFLAVRQKKYNRMKKKYEEILTKDDILTWFSNYRLFFEHSLKALSGNELDFEVTYNRVMTLGILDNIRNIALICINSLISEMYGNQNVMLDFESLPEDSLIGEFYHILLANNKLMADICFKDNYNLNGNTVQDILKKTVPSISRYSLEFIQQPDKNDYSKDFRVYREIDNFAENYIAMDLASEKSEMIIDKEIGVCGLCYGGLELPVIYSIVNQDIRQVSVLKFGSNITGYQNKHALEVRSFAIEDYGGIQFYGIDPSKRYILADDNLLTAKTMQLALNTMYDNNIEVNNVAIVRYPSVNRISQMFMENHGAVDYRFFFDFINGLCFPSPYSWRDENTNDDYEDSLGVFDIPRNNILQYLYKNHDFKEDTEVSSIRGRTKIIEKA